MSDWNFTITRRNRAQLALASTFAVLGGWALLRPAQVLRLGIRPAFLPAGDGPMRTLQLTMACFGAQV